MDLIVHHMEGGTVSTSAFVNVEQPGLLPQLPFLVIKEVGSQRIVAFIPAQLVTKIEFSNNLITALA